MITSGLTTEFKGLRRQQHQKHIILTGWEREKEAGFGWLALFLRESRLLAPNTNIGPARKRNQ
jgi:hypothetical protein